MKTLQIPDGCVTFFVQNRGPVLRDGPIQKLDIPRNHGITFYHLRIGKIARREIEVKKKNLKIIYEVDIVPNLRSADDYPWYTDWRSRDILKKTQSKIKREILSWANEEPSIGGIRKSGTKIYKSRWDKYEITVKWELIQY